MASAFNETSQLTQLEKKKERKERKQKQIEYKRKLRELKSQLVITPYTSIQSMPDFDMIINHQNHTLKGRLAEHTLMKYMQNWIPDMKSCAADVNACDLYSDSMKIRVEIKNCVCSDRSLHDHQINQFNRDIFVHANDTNLAIFINIAPNSTTVTHIEDNPLRLFINGQDMHAKMMEFICATAKHANQMTYTHKKKPINIRIGYPKDYHDESSDDNDNAIPDTNHNTNQSVNHIDTAINHSQVKRFKLSTVHTVDIPSELDQLRRQTVNIDDGVIVVTRRLNKDYRPSYRLHASGDIYFTNNYNEYMPLLICDKSGLMYGRLTANLVDNLYAGIHKNDNRTNSTPQDNSQGIWSRIKGIFNS